MAEYLMSEIQVPGVGEPVMIIKDKEARDDLSTAIVETSPSNPLTFTARSAQKAQSAEIVLEPIQAGEGDPSPENIRPISGHTEVSVKVTNGKESTDPDYAVATDLTKDLGQEVFGGSYNPVSGELVVTWGYIAEYNGETLPGEWISDRDVYAPNTSPSTGAEVCYELATPITYQLSPDEIKLLSGVNNIWTDGTSIKVSYRDGKVATLADLQDTADNLQEQIDQNETMEDETTQLLYKLGVNNGLLFIEEV